MSPARKASPTLPARRSGVEPEGHHTCMRCPVCATETCRVLQDLGMYCETQCAASRSPRRREGARGRLRRRLNTFRQRFRSSLRNAAFFVLTA